MEDCFRAKNSLLFWSLISANVLSFQANYVTGYIVLLGNYVQYFLDKI